MINNLIQHQVLIVGGGLAGLRAAVAASETADTAILSAVHPVRSHSVAAQGGINAPLGNAEEGRDDSWERHAFDTVKGSDYLADQDAVEIMIKEAPASIFELDHWGVPFSRTGEGKIAQRPFGGGAFPRTCYAADKTGHMLMHTLYQQVIKRKIAIYQEWLVTSLVVAEGDCQGVIALNLATGTLEAFAARAVVFATGGAGRIYSRSTNALINTGAGIAIAYRAGMTLKDMEFVQFHPTSLYGSNILITEAARGEGGYLLNNKGERFLKIYAPSMMELAPRDIVARAIQTEIDQGHGFDNAYVHLDLRHLGKEKILERLPGIRDIAISFAGIDPIEKPIPIQPAQHYTMGGIDCNFWGETEIPGFFACGECACVSVHGANRLGGNSLLDTIVFGKRTGERAALFATTTEPSADQDALTSSLTADDQRIRKLVDSSGREDPYLLRQELGETMMEKVGIFRDEEQMQAALNKIEELNKRCRRLRPSFSGRKYNLDLQNNLQLEAMIDVSEAIARGALSRKESRGSHYRRDFEQRDDENWLKHTIARYSPQGAILSAKEVTITKWKPEARKY